MKDIEQAYIVEQEYVAGNWGTEISLIELLEPYGYTTLDDYFSDRFLYLLKRENIPIIHCSIDEARANMIKAMEAGVPGIYLPDEDVTYALVGDSETFDYERAKELGIKICEMGHSGGTIITCNTDFNITINLPNTMNLLSDKFLIEFNKFLLSKGYNTYIDNNDIMLEGKKVAGSVFYGTELSGNFAISISLNDHSELIKELCKKPPIKTPGYLTGITQAEIEAEVNRWLRPI